MCCYFLAYGVTTDIETSYTARIMLVSVIPFVILQLPAIIDSTSVTRVILLITLILVLCLYITYITYQVSFLYFKQFTSSTFVM
ncbi:hypothetical protein HanLR1_Chr15g0578971 [Helianthus annuus]|nr:hypothetical protein HanLR1_Chr15g0578971 [Helianthus annuus]